jgi:hypothetical protein
VGVNSAEFYKLVEEGDLEVALRLALGFELGAKRRGDEAAAKRWGNWARVLEHALESGGRIRVGVYKSEVYVGADLEALEEARGFLGDDQRVAEAVERLREEEG